MKSNRLQSPWCGQLRNVVLVALGLGLGTPTGAIATLVVDTGSLVVSVDTVWAEEGGRFWVGSVEEGQSLSLMVQMRNKRPEPLVVSAINTTGEGFFVQSPSFELAGFASRTLRAFFAPSRVGLLNGEIQILLSTQPDQPIRIPLSGTGTPPLVITGMPASMGGTLSLHPTDGQILFASNENTDVYRTLNGGGANPIWTVLGGDIGSYFDDQGFRRNLYPATPDFLPSNPSVIFVKNSRGLYRNEDLGVGPWQQVSDRFQSRQFIIVPGTEEMFVAEKVNLSPADIRTRIWRSVNGGVNWDMIIDDSAIIDGFPTEAQIAQNPGRPGTVFLLRGGGNPPDPVAVVDSLGRKEDGTYYLHRVLTANGGWRFLKTSAHNPDALYLAGDNGCYRSADNGASWRPMALPNVPLWRAVVEDTRDPGVLYAGSYHGMFISADNGAHWRSIYPGNICDMVATAVDGEPVVYFTTFWGPGPPTSRINHGPLRTPPTPVEGGLVVSPVAVDFGDVGVGAPQTRTITITNLGQGPESIFWTTLPNNAQFSIVGGGFVPWMPGIIARGESKDIVIRYPPGSYRVDTSFVSISTTASNLLNCTIPLRGRGVYPAGFSLSEMKLDFGEVFVGNSATRLLQVTNSGLVPLQLNNIALTPACFTTNTTQVTIPPNTNGVIPVAFLPDAAGAYSGNLTFSTNDPSEREVAVALLGEAGLPPHLEIQLATNSGTASHVAQAESQPAVLDWPLRYVGQVDTRQIVLSNTGLGRLHISGLVSGHGDLTWEPVALPMTVEPGQARPLTVKYAPSSAQDLVTQLAVQSDDPASPGLVEVHLRAQALRVSLDFDPRPGDQGRIALEGLRKNQRFPVQIFSPDMPPCTGYSLDLSFDTAYLSFRSFEKGGAIAQGAELSRPTDAGATVGVVSLERKSESGRIGQKNLLGTVFLEVRRDFKGTARIALTRLLLHAGPGLQEAIPLRVETQVTGRAEERSADFNGDGRIDFYDLFLFGEAFGQVVNSDNAVFNLNGDRKIDFGDFALFVDAFDDQRQAKPVVDPDRWRAGSGRNSPAWFALFEPGGGRGGDAAMVIRVALEQAKPARGYGFVLHYDPGKYNMTAVRDISGDLSGGRPGHSALLVASGRAAGELAIGSIKTRGEAGFTPGPLVEVTLQLVGTARSQPEDFQISGGVLVDEMGEICAEEHQSSAEPVVVSPQSSLRQNAPNPFNASTLITYQIREPAAVSLVIYNLLGQTIRVLVQEYQVAGEHAVAWDGKGDAGQVMANGVYIYRLQAGTATQLQRMVMLK